MHEFLHLPIIASTHGGQIDQIIIIVHYLMFALGIGWGIFFVYTLIRFRKSRQPKADYHGVRSHRSSYLELVIAIIEAVLLIAFSIPFWNKFVIAFPQDPDAMQVHVTAEQFAWNIHYPGADGKFGRTDPKLIDVQTNPLGLDPTDPNALDDITTTNQFHLPVDRHISVQLTSKDVIHSFGVPLLRVKQDVIPGMLIPTSFTANKIGTYEIACSQLCGLGHYRMRGYVNVESAEEFSTWLASQAKFGQSASGSGESW